MNTLRRGLAATITAALLAAFAGASAVAADCDWHVVNPEAPEHEQEWGFGDAGCENPGDSGHVVEPVPCEYFADGSVTAEPCVPLDVFLAAAAERSASSASPPMLPDTALPAP